MSDPPAETDSPNRPLPPRAARILIIIGFAVWLAANLLTLTRYPAASCDESFYARTSLWFFDAAMTFCASASSESMSGSGLYNSRSAPETLR